MKFKICIVADVPNWAFDNIANKLKKDLKYKYDIRIVYFDRRKEADYFYEFLEQNRDCDLLHFLNRRMLLLMGSDIFKLKVENSGKNLKEYIEKMKNKISTAVYDYIDLTPQGILEHAPIVNNYSKKYYTSTQELFDIYSSIKILKKPDAMVHDICDKESFLPINLDRFNYDKINNREIVIGWVGNSVHNDEKEVDLKGFNSILKPVIKELQIEGYKIRGFYADRRKQWRTTEEMPEYYSQIDICVCASIHEGTPRPVLESMYSGVPLISTCVGIVPEAFGEKQKEFIIGSRENGKNDEEVKRNLKEKIIYLYNNRQMFKVLSDENIKSIDEFDGGKTIAAFEDFFDKCLES